MLPAIIKKFFSPTMVLREEDSRAIAVAQVKAIAEISTAFTSIAEFITGQGLQDTLKGNAKLNAVNSILSGITTHAGRMGLDARTIQQDAIDSIHRVEAFHDKFEQHLKDKSENEWDDEIKEANE